VLKNKNFHKLTKSGSLYRRTGGMHAGGRAWKMNVLDAWALQCPRWARRSVCVWGGVCVCVGVGVLKNTNTYIIQRQDFQYRRSRGMHAVGRTWKMT
jgi:hypothetical protein